MELDMATLTVSPSTKSRCQDGQSRNFRLHHYTIDYSEIPETEWERPRILAFCCFSQYVESPQRNDLCNPTTQVADMAWHGTCVFFMLNSSNCCFSHALHTALITSHDGCPAGEGCSRTDLASHLHQQTSCVKYCLCVLSVSKHTVHTSMYILINVIYTYIDIYIYYIFKYIYIFIKLQYIYIHASACLRISSKCNQHFFSPCNPWPQHLIHCFAMGHPLVRHWLPHVTFREFCRCLLWGLFLHDYSKNAQEHTKTRDRFH